MQARHRAEFDKIPGNFDRFKELRGYLLLYSVRNIGFQDGSLIDL